VLRPIVIEDKEGFATAVSKDFSMEVDKVEELPKEQELRERIPSHEAKSDGHRKDSKNSNESVESIQDEALDSKSKKTFGRTPDGTGMFFIPDGTAEGNQLANVSK
jgi:hypothetical protein